MASPLIEFQVQGSAGDVPKTFNAYCIGVIEPIDGTPAQCTVYYNGIPFTIEGSYANVVAAIDALFV